MNKNMLASLYSIRFRQEELPRKNAIWRELCQHFLQQYIPENATVVDIACGYGEFLHNIQAARKIAIDLNPDTKNCLDSAIEFHQQSALLLGNVVQNEADVVFTSNFLEHLASKQELETFLDHVLQALKPGGRYIILGPNLRYLPGKYWDFYDHTLGLTHVSLCEILQVKGFRIQHCIDRFLPYTTQGALPTHPALVKAYLHLPFAWPLFGKQFFIVAQK